ncbi:MAG: di-trans,poly-cis-decaprenylcistransferase [Clostridia bacterium]|nr:di-trans,poly-cis-decaprenylcistransferase [Clostridia bacterium]
MADYSNDHGVYSLAIIPDGNRRWAKERGLPAIAGHNKGARVFKDIAKICYRKGIKYVTFYAFSTENWNRKKREVSGLMKILSGLLDNFENELGEDRGKIRIRVIGDRSALSKDLIDGIDRVERATAANTGINVYIAINYGSRLEIVSAVRKIAEDARAGILAPENITEETVSKELYTADVPDPDLLIRTSGEMRISNYLLWQIAYSELYFADCYWPDFDGNELDKALADFASRKRRYGK